MSCCGNCHDYAAAESFFQLLKRERIKIYGTREEAVAIFLIASKCFITKSFGMVRAIRCYRQNMKTTIINGSEVFRLSVAIQVVDSRYTWLKFRLFRALCISMQKE